MKLSVSCGERGAKLMPHCAHYITQESPPCRLASRNFSGAAGAHRPLSGLQDSLSRLFGLARENVTSVPVRKFENFKACDRKTTDFAARHDVDRPDDRQVCHRTTARGPMHRNGLQEMFVTIRHELKRFLLSRGVSSDDAEDIMQDLFVKIKGAETGPIARPKAYLYQMANNLAHDRRRTEERRSRLDSAWSALHFAADDGADYRPNAEAVMLARDHLQRVEAVLEHLPDRTYSVFRRFRIEGETQKAIANSLGVSLSAVEKHLQRAYRAVLDARRGLELQDKPGGREAEGGKDA